MFINKSFASFLFGRVKRIDLGDLWNKIVLKFNGMIEGLMGGKNVIGFLQEYIREISAEVGNRDFLRFFSLGELC